MTASTPGTAGGWWANDRDPRWTCPPPSGEAQAFHRSLDDYAPTKLVDLPDLAADLGVGRVLAKDESTRLGLPAFKALGASWAVHRALAAHLPEQSRDSGKSAPGPVGVVAATDGNHGRAVARFARLAGHPARIYVPAGAVHPTAVQAIRDEGADVVEVAADYDATVAAAADNADRAGDVLVQDTAWEGYEEVPGWIVEGYLTLFAEIDDQLAARALGAPDLVVVPTGVGSLLQGALAHYRSAEAASGTSVVAVEPATAACIPPSLAAGHPVTVETTGTIMSGLNCGTPSSLAWPLIRDGLDAAAAVTDAEAIEAGRRLAGLGVQAGPCGAAALAGARRALSGAGADKRRARLGIDSTSTVVLTVTEGTGANPFPS